MTVVDNIAAINKAADKTGVPRIVALATAMWESHLDNKNVGDGGTSFGLFQLHRGGELGTHSPDWAFDPYNNSLTALTVISQQARANPNLSWAQVVIKGQRPAARVVPQYVAFLNTTFASTGFGGTPAMSTGDPNKVPDLTPYVGKSKGGHPIFGAGSPGAVVDGITHAAGHAVGGVPVVGGIVKGVTSIGDFIGLLTSPSFWKRVGYGFAGSALIVGGTVLLLRTEITSTLLPASVPSEVAA